MATCSSVSAWSIPGTVEPDGLSSMGSHRVGHDWSDLAAAAAAAAFWKKEARKAAFVSFCERVLMVEHRHPRCHHERCNIPVGPGRGALLSGCLQPQGSFQKQRDQILASTCHLGKWHSLRTSVSSSVSWGRGGTRCFCLLGCKWKAHNYISAWHTEGPRIWAESLWAQMHPHRALTAATEYSRLFIDYDLEWPL